MTKWSECLVFKEVITSFIIPNKGISQNSDLILFFVILLGTPVPYLQLFELRGHYHLCIVIKRPVFLISRALEEKTLWTK